MQVDLDRKTLRYLATLVSPNKQNAPDKEARLLYDNCAIGTRGEFIWFHESIDKLSDEQLFELFNICKNSWL